MAASCVDSAPPSLPPPLPPPAPPLDPREDFAAWLGAHGVSGRVLEALESELGIGDYEALLACAAHAPVRAELLAAAKERLPFAFYAALRRVAELVARRGDGGGGGDGCGGGGADCGRYHDGAMEALALHPFIGSLLDTIVHTLSSLSRELSQSAQRFRLLDAAAFYAQAGDDGDARLSSPERSVHDPDHYAEEPAEASVLDMAEEDGAAPDGGAAAARWARGGGASLSDGALEPHDHHGAGAGPSAPGSGEEDATAGADAWRAASVKTEPFHEGEKAGAGGATEGGLACELDDAGAFCQGAVEAADDDDGDYDEMDDDDDDGGGGGRALRWASLERGAGWADRAAGGGGHEPPERWSGNFHPALPKLESSAGDGTGGGGAYAQHHHGSPPPCNWQTAHVTAVAEPRLDPTDGPRGPQRHQQPPAERFVRSDSECEAPAFDGGSPRVCPDCGMSFRTPSKLCRHRQSRHSEQKPYACDECGKRFSLIHNLNQHRRIHSGEKPFVCEECGMTFGRKYHLHRHKKTHSLH